MRGGGLWKCSLSWRGTYEDAHLRGMHATEDMVPAIKETIFQAPGCGRVTRFGVEGAEHTPHCRKHSMAGMALLRLERACQAPRVSVTANFDVEGTTRLMYARSMLVQTWLT